MIFDDNLNTNLFVFKLDFVKYVITDYIMQFKACCKTKRTNKYQICSLSDLLIMK